MENLSTPWLISAALAIMLVTMDYVRRTGPLNDLFRRRDDTGGLLIPLLVIGLIVAAILLFPQAAKQFNRLSSNGSDFYDADVGAKPIGESREVNSELVFGPVKSYQQEGTERGHGNGQIVPERKSDYHDAERSGPTVGETRPRYPMAVAVKGRPNSNDIFYLIPDWAGSDPTKALARLKGEASRHYVFQIAGKDILQVGYGPFKSVAAGEAFQKRHNLKRKPRAFRWLR